MSGNLSKLDANQVLRSSYDDATRRLNVNAEVVATIGNVDVVIDAAGGDNIAIADKTGTNYVKVNPDGSLNVDIQNITLNQSVDSIAIGDGTTLVKVDPVTQALSVQLPLAGSNKLVFNEITSVPNGILTQITTYTVPLGKVAYLQQAIFSGTNLAQYEVYINGILNSRQRTVTTQLNGTFLFAVTSNNGLALVAGDIISIKVLHTRPSPGDFDATFQLIEK